MAEDIVPELYKKIKLEIDNRLKSDKKASSIQKKVDKGKATYADVQAYALRVGKISSKVLQDDLDDDDLPGGDLYYNIAQRTVGKTLEDNLTRVNKIGAPVQVSLNTAAGLGIGAMSAKMNKDRLHELVSDIADCAELDRAHELMGEPVINMTQAFADDLVKENADMQYSIGLKPTITRTAEAGCCEWCAGLEGTYEYPLSDEQQDVYQRHENCRCVVEYHAPNSNTVQNVHTRQYRTDAATIEARKNYGL